MNLFGPANNWTLLALILVAPLAGAFVNGVFGKRLGKSAVRLVALSAIGTSFVAALITFVRLHGLHEALEHSVQGGERHALHQVVYHIAGATNETVKLSWLAWQWMDIGSPNGGRLPIDVKFSVDALSGVMMLVITGIGFLIHVYSTSYMAKDSGYYRYFSYLNLFVFSMLVLILADNMAVMFVGWEGVGLCSYLLISFWFDKEANARAARKAFVVNRIGDFGLIIGMLVIAYAARGLDWDSIHAETAKASSMFWRHSIGGFHLPTSLATLACLALMLGAAGKSAQLPLYVWLPDAMVGPTPVSALIHAATMVTSGIYLICRLNFLFAMSPYAMMIIATVGVLTALFAATMALVAHDIKKILAYSTVSQLGYMFLGVGVGAFDMGFFHVFTHAFFKACLFLGAGSIIHTLHARIHDESTGQDIRSMGGLRRYMPWTYWSMLAATLAISGAPLTSGFFSKDGILFATYTNILRDPLMAANESSIAHGGNELAITAKMTFFSVPAWYGPTLFALGVLGAVLTAFYMFRLFFRAFHGDFAGWRVDESKGLARNPFEAERPLSEEPGDAPEHDSQEPESREIGHEAPSEAPWPMTLPVALLGVGALVVGFLYAAPFRIKPLAHFLSTVWCNYNGSAMSLEDNGHATGAIIRRAGAHALEWPLAIPGIVAFAVGFGAAYWVYIHRKGVPAAVVRETLPTVYKTLYNGWYVDKIYEEFIVRTVNNVAFVARYFDAWIVDGLIAKLSAFLVMVAGEILRFFQTGRVAFYGALMSIGVVGVGAFFAFPHFDVQMLRAGDSSFEVSATPGLGYTYRFSVDGDNASAPSTPKASRTVYVAPAQTKLLRVDVTSLFGLSSSKQFTLVNEVPTEPAAPAASSSATLGQ